MRRCDNMAEIQVQESKDAAGWNFVVTVSEKDSITRHSVTLARSDYDRITGGRMPPTELIVESFEFLLARESKESILSSFDLTVISRYFPEYEDVIRK